MSRLALFLLGPPRLELDGEPIRLDRRKALALLAYLALGDRAQHCDAHPRDSLVTLLWPDYDSTRGRAALRRTLFALRQAVGEGILAVDRDEIGLDPAADVWFDVLQFRQHLAECETHGHPPADVCPACVEPLSQAVDLAGGDFLAGFGLPDTLNFDDWQLLQTEALRRELAGALDRLVQWHSTQCEFEPALAHARRRLALDALDEDAHRSLMRLYAWSGRRPAALRQYEDCAAILEDQLGVSPQEETYALYQAILEGRAPPLPGLDAPPKAEVAEPVDSLPFLVGESSVERPVFVGRARELEALSQFLEQALGGQSRVVFVTGDAGSGKTALIQEFATRAQAAHGDLIFAGGQCNAHTGTGDPYLPFREILGLLSGDVEAPWVAGAMTKEQASRLWRLIPLAVQAFTKAGPDLIDLLVPGEALLERARLVRPWPVEPVALSRLEELATRRAEPTGTLRLQQTALFEQVTQVLRILAANHPMLLTLDDLQWADAGSVNLLFHIGRRIGGSRILIVGAYRPAEVALGRPTAAPFVGDAEGPSGGLWDRHTLVPGRHPLEPVVNELKRSFADIEVDLEPTEGRSFVDALLDSEPNCLSEAFREALYQRTLGHPLFTVDLLRGMQERGDVLHDADGRWIEGPTLDWETLPARVEAVIAERLARLPQNMRELLTIASVQGETFTAEVVSHVQGTDDRQVVRSLSETLDRQHRLVSARGMARAGSQRLSQYRFRHILYQRYLYGTLDEAERVYLHEQVGTAIEGLYPDQEREAVAVQLARHFEEAGITEKAITYLHQAGARAVRLSAYEEGLTHLRRASVLLMTQPGSPERDRQELDLQMALGMALQGARGTQASEMKDAYVRARELCLHTGDTSRLCRVLGELALHHFTRAEHQKAREFGEHALREAQRAEDPLLEATSHWYLGIALFCQGEFATARTHLERLIAFYVPEEHYHAFLLVRGSDSGVSAMAYAACTLWCLGYPEQAQQRSREALALARALDHPFTLADVLAYGGCLFNKMRRDGQALWQNADELVQLAREKLQAWSGIGECYHGPALALLGRVEDGLTEIRQGIEILESREARVGVSTALTSLAEAQAQAGRIDEGLATLSKAQAFVEQTGERYEEAEIHRVRGDLLLRQGDEAEAEASLQRAIGVARRQQARSWELRAATSLARLWQAQGRAEEAQRLLGGVYDWFTEGFETPDLVTAAALLAELGGGNA